MSNDKQINTPDLHRHFAKLQGHFDYSETKVNIKIPFKQQNQTMLQFITIKSIHNLQ